MLVLHLMDMVDGIYWLDTTANSAYLVALVNVVAYLQRPIFFSGQRDP